MPMTKEKFDESGNLIGYWVCTARTLLNSSIFLKDNDFSTLSMQQQDSLTEEELNFRNFSSVSRMLRGMALECFLKAILIKKLKIEISNGEIKKNPYNDHDLVKMVKGAEIEFDELEKESLKILTAEIVLGRFPVFKKYEKYNNLPLIPNMKPVQKAIYWDDKLEKKSCNLLKRIIAELA